MTIAQIQKSVRAAKDKTNTFGGYNYRNAEGILAELKAHLPDGWSVAGTDEIEERGPHLFLRHTVSILDAEGIVVGTAAGWAMHPEQKKGMDPAQITGACSSYAKKYALQNLLAVDDGSVDPDATNKHDGKTDMAFAEVATQHLSEAELEDPIKVAQAYADAIEAKALSYKQPQWLARFMKSRASEMSFVLKHDPERHAEVRAAALAHLKTLEGKAA